MTAAPTSWLRRSLPALLALVVLVPAAVVASLSVGAFDRLANRPLDVVMIDADDEPTLAGAAIRVVETRVVDSGTPEGDELRVTPGTALVIVTIGVTPGDADAGTCTLMLVASDPDRRWDDNAPGVSYYPERADDAPYGCALGHENAYRLESAFLVPADVVDAVQLEITTTAELPRALRWRLAPVR